MKKKKPLRQNLVLWVGPSQINGKRIMLCASGFTRNSENKKTGAMIQTWILPFDVVPSEAVRSGKDACVCGSCPLANMKGCYVRMDGPDSVWRAVFRSMIPKRSRRVGAPKTWFRDGASYRFATPAEARKILGDKPIRLGAYGDPAAVPEKVWRSLLCDHKGTRTGYTHRWADVGAWAKDLLMASCDSPEDSERAARAGWRRFRLGYTPAIVQDMGTFGKEFLCPASDERRNVTCLQCRLCDGARPDDRRASPYIIPHGPRSHRIDTREEVSA